MNASTYINKIRTRTESNEQKVQQPGATANYNQLISANGCSLSYIRLYYTRLCNCKISNVK
jgi:hypothetical protein